MLPCTKETSTGLFSRNIQRVIDIFVLSTDCLCARIVPFPNVAVRHWHLTAGISVSITGRKWPKGYTFQYQKGVFKRTSFDLRHATEWSLLVDRSQTKPVGSSGLLIVMKIASVCLLAISNLKFLAIFLVGYSFKGV